MPATDANPRGYFENLNFNKICVNLLKSAGADWWKVKNFDVGRIPSGDLERGKLAGGRLIEELAADQIFALKDPRLCFLLPALRSLFPSPVFVHVVRSPLEVAMSLNERNGFGIAEGMALWEAYNRAALAATSGGPRVIVNYDSLVAEPSLEADRLYQNLEKAGVVGMTRDSDVAIAELVSSDLHRQRSTDDEDKAFLTNEQNRLWASLAGGNFPSLKEGPQEKEMRERLLSCLEMQSVLQTSRRLQLRCVESDPKIASLSEELKSERKNAQSQETIIASLRSDLEDTHAQIGELAQSGAELADRFEQQLATDKGTIGTLRNELEAEREKRKTQEDKLAALVVDLSAMKGELDELSRSRKRAELEEERARFFESGRIDALQSELEMEREIRNAQDERFRVITTDLQATRHDLSELTKFGNTISQSIENRFNSAEHDLVTNQISIENFSNVLVAIQKNLKDLSGSISSIVGSQIKKDQILNSLKIDLAFIEDRMSAFEEGKRPFSLSFLPDKRSHAGPDRVNQAIVQEIKIEFDPQFYLREYPDVKEGGLNPIYHYLAHGWKEERRPSPEWGNEEFLRKFPAICSEELSNLIDAEEEVDSEGQSSQLQIERERRRDQRNALATLNADLTAVQAAVDIVQRGGHARLEIERKRLAYDSRLRSLESEMNAERAQRAAQGDQLTAVGKNLSRAKVTLNELAHRERNSEAHIKYLREKQEVLDSGLWDEKWYLSHYGAQYAQWRRTQVNQHSPIDHYLKVGWKEGFHPSSIFKLDRASELKAANPISNFLEEIRPNFHWDENIWQPSQATIDAYKLHRKTRETDKVFYCCIIDDYDQLSQPYFIENDWDYVCFTDSPYLLSKGEYGVWEIREAQRSDLPADLRNRYHKLHPHALFPNYQESIYVDGNVNVLSSYFFEEIDRRCVPILLPRHFKRNCIYDEIDALLASPRTSEANRKILPLQRKFLEEMSFPSQYGLTENNVMFRRHHDQTVIKVMTRCWDMLQNFSTRDQVSMCYALWREGLDPGALCIPNTRLIHGDFWVFAHQPKREVTAHHKVQPAFADGAIPIFLSCNNAFISYLGVLLTSIVENSSKDRNYDIVVLESDVTEKSKETIRSITRKKNISIRFYNMAPVLEQLKDLDVYVEGYVPAETYNKIFLSEITEGYEKLLYIDTDIVVRADLAELYDIDLFGKAIGSSPNVANISAAYQNKEIRGQKFGDYLRETLGITEFEKYFQAGIVSLDMTHSKVRNLAALSISKLRKIRKPIFFDQCIFNSIFYDDVQYFSTAWNHVWYLQNYSHLKHHLRDDIFFDYAKGRLDPKIIHYASGDKPTNKFDWKLSSYFWNYASRSPYAEELFGQVIDRASDNDDRLLSRSKLCTEPVPRTLVHLHVHYQDQLSYLFQKLESIEGSDWHLLVTANANFDEIENAVKARYQDATILRLKNQGFDAYPFLKALQASNLSEFDFILKLHTKNARPDREDSLVYGLPVPGHKWRDDMVDALLKSKELFRDNLKAFEQNSELGCLASEKYIFSIHDNNEMRNYDLRSWMNKFGLERGSHYVGGTMFMARTYPFHRLKSINPDSLDFASGDQVSGSHKNLAHVFERLFGLVLENEGLSIRGANGDR